jgi:hypothetical protein
MNPGVNGAFRYAEENKENKQTDKQTNKQQSVHPINDSSLALYQKHEKSENQEQLSPTVSCLYVLLVTAQFT